MIEPTLTFCPECQFVSSEWIIVVWAFKRWHHVVKFLGHRKEKHCSANFYSSQMSWSQKLERRVSKTASLGRFLTHWDALRRYSERSRCTAKEHRGVASWKLRLSSRVAVVTHRGFLKAWSILCFRRSRMENVLSVFPFDTFASLLLSSSSPNINFGSISKVL